MDKILLVTYRSFITIMISLHYFKDDSEQDIQEMSVSLQIK